MNILKIANRYINLDQMTDVLFFENGSARVCFSGQGEQQPHSVVFGDAEAKALRQWLDYRATDVMTPPTVQIGSTPLGSRR